SRLSDDLVDYYYGVRQSEAILNRPFYLGESTTNVTLGINSNWQWDRQNRFVANLSVTALGSEIEDSPLIDASTNVQFILGYLYVF
ncbi:MAG: MipA/OmpV family protein, partial [Pseudomonadota bacterium]